MFVEGDSFGRGAGRSKKAAEQAAAKNVAFEFRRNERIVGRI
ncbi:MAG: putative dsRNA-binding protein [Alkalibacterium sp.]|nr:putative dsRNA-binding protein [Alkalibacterium sp.]